MTSDENGSCVAPGCGAATPSAYHHLCDACGERVEAAKVRARSSLMEMMTAERAEVEAWLSEDWAPTRRWVIADEDYHPEPLDDVVKRMVEATAEDWGPPFLGFVDDAARERLDRWRQEHHPESEAHPETAWLVPSESDTATAWRAHAAPIIRAALEQALATFPLMHAGREIKRAITQQDSYGKDQRGGGFEELWEGSGDTGLSDGAEDYLELRYSPDEAWMCDLDCKPKLWRRYRVLSDDIMAILDAYWAVKDHDR